MKKIRIIISVLLAAVLLICSAACAKTSPADEQTQPADDTVQSSVSESPSDDKAEASEPQSTETTTAETESGTTDEQTTDAEDTEAESELTEETAQPEKEPETVSPAANGVRYTSVDEAMSKMTLEEKVGQLFVIMPEALYPSMKNKKFTQSGVDYAFSLSDGMKETYAAYPAGGFILFGGNISSGDQLKGFTSQLHDLGPVRPFVYIDEEGGTVARIGNSGCISVPKYGNMQSIADTGDTDNAYAVGAGIGGYLKDYGIDLDFAPVADVNTNPSNPVIGRRAFGSDPALAGDMVSAVIKGLHSQGVGSCIKHFPGHGDTNTDTHKAYAETLKTWDEIKNCEMIPFIDGINAGTDMVMVAHISAPNVTGDDTPATLSYTLVTEKLRRELGYNGVVTTDSMSMLAVADRYSPAEAAVTAIKAGIDIVLIPDDYIAAYNGVLDAVKNGEISEARINESVRRILTMKFN